MAHRGPDDDGFLERGPVTLGMRRLSIIDVAGGKQPIFNEDRTVGIVFNGAIYNYVELQRELEARGHRFGSRSDTEAIVHAYEEWGEECVHRLRGMFAFAILDWRGDSTSRSTPGSGEPVRLFAARDRLGIKPLYWHHGPAGFLFASEVRALLATGLVEKRVSYDGTASYLAFGSVQEPLTLIDQVFSLPPGHRLTVVAGRDAPVVTIERYWDLPEPGSIVREAPGDLRGSLRGTLSDAVRLHTRSDVPFGAFLSSGIDSSAIVGLMAETSASPVKTFTIVFDEREFSEAGLARETARRYRTDHHEILVTPAEVLTDLPLAIRSLDQPSIDGINTYYVSRAAKQAGITVALSGLGGDEIFAGYPTFRTAPRLQRAARAIGPAGRRLVGALPEPPGDKWSKLKTALSGDDYFGHPYFTVRALFTREQRAALLPAMPEAEHVSPADAAARAYRAKAEKYDAVNEISFLECKTYMPNTLLRDADGMSMAHSLEVRVPFVDHVLVEQVFALHGQHKLRGKGSKPLLVDAVGDLLIPGVTSQKKRTFTFPWRHWLRDELRGTVEQSLLRASRGNVALDPAGVREVWHRFERGDTSWSRPWALHVLATWIDVNLT